jgi:hypothetical protein
MTAEELRKYLARLLRELPLDRYVERRFTALEDTGGIPMEMDFRFRGMLRDREPKLPDILKHSRVLILAEPGGGKSVVARAAIHQFAHEAGHLPVFAELKGYRGDLSALISTSAPAALLDPVAAVEGRLVSRAYVLDGIDEIPRGTLPQLGADLQRLFERDPSASVLLTARQAFYAAHRDLLPAVTSLFHVLDFSDKDIAEYVAKSNVNVGAFLGAARAADASEEIRNPFILSVMIEKYREEGALSDRRSENLSYMIDRLIQSRPRANRHRQRRALKMLGVGLETYSRNELTEDEAFGVIKAAMRISDAEARALLDELYASILKRTANGLTFQMRSYGEYLAAEELENAPSERVKELAFLDLNTPNESWLNAVSYLVELNPRVRAYFVRRHPLWTISSSPAAFSNEEKTAIVASALQTCIREKQYVLHHPLINARRLSRLVTDAAELDLLASLADPDDVVRGNAIALLGMRRHPQALAIALDVVKNRRLGVDLRYCAVVALVNVGTPAQVPELLATLDREDPLHMNFLDMIGAIIDEPQIPTVFPLIFRENAMLSATYYHFHEFKSREALLQTLRYFVDHPNDLNGMRAETYVEPIFEQLPAFLDLEVAEVCADLLETIERLQIYPDQSGPMPKLFASMREADRDGRISRIFFTRMLRRPVDQRRRIFYVDRLLVSLMTRETAQWLIDVEAFDLIRELSPYCYGDTRELFRPYSGGVIDAQDANTRACRDEESKREESRARHIGALQESLLQQNSLNGALQILWELKEDYWLELPGAYRGWLASEISNQMGVLDLERSIRWEGSTLWAPHVLPFLLKIIDRYELRIDPDEPLVFAVTAMDAGLVAKYCTRYPLSERALGTLKRLLTTPSSPRTLEEIVRFLDSTEIWCAEIAESLKILAADPADRGYLQITALNLLVKHGIENAFIEGIADTGANRDLQNRAFEILIEAQHRPTIERVLATLTDDELRGGNVHIPDMSPLGWIGKIKSDFAWDKLATLRARALQLELPMVVGLVSGALANTDSARAAAVIRRQADLAPPEWRVTQVAQAIEQERTARIEAAQRTPFDDVIRKLKGSTSMNRLKVLCEGTTDRPVFRSLIDQAGDASDIIFGSVGGWGGLRAEPDPNTWLVGCKEAIMVLDGDEGRHLRKRGKPYTKLAREERRKLSGVPIDLRILERYGIENYFPQQVFEKVIGGDLSAYFPIPDHASVIEHLSSGRASWKHRLKKFVARIFGLPQPVPKQPLYSKSRNTDAAGYLKLEDLKGTDLFDIVRDISETAKLVTDE